MGREYKISEILKSATDTTGVTLTTYTEFDIAGKPLTVIDPKQYSAGGTINSFEYTYDMSGNPLKVTNVDSGTKVTIANFAGNPIYIEDLRSRVKYSYDQLQRPLEVRVTENGTERVAEKFEYGESLSSPETKNLKGQIIKHYDQSGLNQFSEYSFKGELFNKSKKILKTIKQLLPGTQQI
jgi:YD repeat-containing protein